MAKVETYVERVKALIANAESFIAFYSGPNCGVEHGLAAHAVAMWQQYRDGARDALDLVNEVWK